MNNVAAHGIPDSRRLQSGDILNIDVTVFVDGHHGDCSETVAVGAEMFALIFYFGLQY